jgi:hypothetical protein
LGFDGNATFGVGVYVKFAIFIIVPTTGYKKVKWDPFQSFKLVFIHILNEDIQAALYSLMDLVRFGLILYFI